MRRAVQTSRTAQPSGDSVPQEPDRENLIIDTDEDLRHGEEDEGLES